jgi:hypothetical protein
MEKSKLKASFVIVQDRDLHSWHVHVTFPLAAVAVPTDVGGFETKAEAKAWVKTRSTRWLKMQFGARNA